MLMVLVAKLGVVNEEMHNSCLANLLRVALPAIGAGWKSTILLST